MPAGPLRHRIDVQNDGSDPDSPGDDGYTDPSWSDWLSDEPAEVLTTRGGETVRGSIQVDATTTHLIRVRHRSGYRAERQRSVLGGNNLYHTFVHDPDGRRRELLIEAIQRH